MATFQLEQVKSDTSLSGMVQFLQDLIEFGDANQGTKIRFNKRGTYIPKCRSGFECSLIDSAYDRHQNVIWSNSSSVDTDEGSTTQGPCRYRHERETHDEYYVRTGLPDTRALRPFRAFLHVASGVVPKVAHPNLKWYRVREWRDLPMGRSTLISLEPLFQDSSVFETLGIDEPRRALRVRRPYDHLGDSLNYNLDLVGSESYFYFDPSRLDREPSNNGNRRSQGFLDHNIQVSAGGDTKTDPLNGEFPKLSQQSARRPLPGVRHPSSPSLPPFPPPSNPSETVVSLPTVQNPLTDSFVSSWATVARVEGTSSDASTRSD